MSTMTRRRRQPTAEQLEKSAAKRERFKALTKAVSAMSEDQRRAMIDRIGAIVTCEGRALSHYNSCLIASQLATASVVGGFWQWKRQGRRVKKGESALSLWIPAKGAKASSEGPAPAEAAEASSEGAEAGRRSNFICGSVFDISQTEEDTASSAEAQEIAAGQARIDAERDQYERDLANAERYPDE